MTRSKAAILAGIVLLLALFAWPGTAWAVVIERASVDSSEVQAGGHSSAPSLSSDGRYVAFESNASNLVANDTNGTADVFVRDRQTGQTTRVSVGTGGTEATGGPSSNPSISADGRYVAFQSDAHNLVAGDTNASADVFVHDRQTGETARVSVATGGTQATGGGSTHACISGDGQYVAFSSVAINLLGLGGDTNGLSDVFVRDLVGGTTERVSVDSAEAQASGGDSDYPSISSDGDYVAFMSSAGNLVANDTNATSDVFVRDRTAGTTKRVSVATGGTEGNEESGIPAISGDGRYIAFPSFANNLVSGDTNVKSDIFVYDQTPGTTTRVSVSGTGAQANDHSYLCSISGNGRYVAFDSQADNLVSRDTGYIYDVFVRDRTAGTTRRVSVAPDGTQANDQSDTAVISGDGNYVAFKSYATNLVSDDTNGVTDIFVDARETRYEHTDSHLAYLGAWSTATTASASGGSFKYANSAGSSMVVSFEGTHLGWIATTGPSYGIAKVSLDGAASELVDLYSAGTRYQQSVYRTDLLSAGAHTLSIEWSGTKNSGSSGYVIAADAFEVLGALTQATGPTRYQQDDANFEYTGPWATNSPVNWLLSGGTFASVDAPGSSVNVEFTGTYCAWIGKKGPGYGRAQVVLDQGTASESVTIVDLYRSSDAYKQRVYDTGFLKNESHTLSIYWINQKNASATGTRINVDTFDLFGTLGNADPAPPILWRYQQTDSRIAYLGSWSTGSTWSASGGSFCSTGQTGAAAVIKFTGTSVKLIAKTCQWYGIASVQLDDEPDVAEVDFYSASTLYKQPVYGREGLSPGEHTLTIKCTGTPSPGHTGTAISLDALDITGYLTQALTRYQQDDTALEYAGTWTTASTWSASGGSYAIADAVEDKVTITFEGTYLAWYAKTIQWYGKATVTLDGNPCPDVDLYSPSTLWKKKVYDTGLLADISHTLIIKWSGTKNPASLGASIDVDAFDVIGTLTDITP